MVIAILQMFRFSCYGCAHLTSAVLDFICAWFLFVRSAGVDCRVLLTHIIAEVSGGEVLCKLFEGLLYLGCEWPAGRLGRWHKVMITKLLTRPHTHHPLLDKIESEAVATCPQVVLLWGVLTRQVLVLPMTVRSHCVEVGECILWLSCEWGEGSMSIARLRGMAPSAVFVRGRGEEVILRARSRIGISRSLLA